MTSDGGKAVLVLLGFVFGVVGGLIVFFSASFLGANLIVAMIPAGITTVVIMSVMVMSAKK